MEPFADIKMLEAGSKCLYSLEEIEFKLSGMMLSITQDMHTQKPVVIGVMRGALAMMGYMLPRFPFYIEVDYVHASRYQKNLTTGELLWLHEPHLSLKNRSVLLIDDILDQGVTLKAISEKCLALGAANVKIAVLCRKTILGFTPAIEADYVAFDVPDAYIFGYGMDFEGGWRNAPGIYALLKPAN
jgi:hypoxanthine phosphoribosyltransferase